jgi:hypothetical protein
MKKLFVISFVVFLFSCSVQKECNVKFNLSNLDIDLKDSVNIKVERIVYTYLGNFVRGTNNVWYRHRGIVDFKVGDSVVVFNEFKTLPPCPREWGF